MNDKPDPRTPIVSLQPSALVLPPCLACPCPEICTGGVLCELAPDPARYAHIKNVSAIKRGELRSAPLPTHVQARRRDNATSVATPCCGR